MRNKDNKQLKLHNQDNIQYLKLSFVYNLVYAFIIFVFFGGTYYLGINAFQLYSEKQLEILLIQQKMAAVQDLVHSQGNEIEVLKAHEAKLEALLKAQTKMLEALTAAQTKNSSSNANWLTFLIAGLTPVGLKAISGPIKKIAVIGPILGPILNFLVLSPDEAIRSLTEDVINKIAEHLEEGTSSIKDEIAHNVEESTSSIKDKIEEGTSSIKEELSHNGEALEKVTGSHHSLSDIVGQHLKECQYEKK